MTLDPAVVLEPATVEDGRELARLMKPRDVWRNLEYHEAPAALVIRGALKRGDHHCLFIRAGQDKRTVGFFLLYGIVMPAAAVEFDIAITDTTDRRGGLARRAIFAFEDFMLLQGRCAELWAWIDATNRPCLELVRSCGWPIVAVHKNAKQMVDGPVDAVEVRMDLPRLQQLRQQRQAAEKTP